MKYCYRCCQEKTEDRFYKRNDRPCGYQTPCKQCRNKQRKERRHNDAEFNKRCTKHTMKWANAHREKLNKQRRGVWNRKYNLKKSYGLTETDVRQMYVNQKNCCIVCGKFIPYKKIEIDHDHKTGKIRGLVHRRCNLLIGHIETNLNLLPHILKYIGAKLEEMLCKKSDLVPLQ